MKISTFPFSELFPFSFVPNCQGFAVHGLAWVDGSVIQHLSDLWILWWWTSYFIHLFISNWESPRSSLSLLLPHSLPETIPIPFHLYRNVLGAYRGRARHCSARQCIPLWDFIGRRRRRAPAEYLPDWLPGLLVGSLDAFGLLIKFRQFIYLFVLFVWLGLRWLTHLPSLISLIPPWKGRFNCAAPGQTHSETKQRWTENRGRGGWSSLLKI